MPLLGLDHVNIHTADLERLANWYEQTLELKRGWRPGFEDAGCWLYLGKAPIVHLIENPDHLKTNSGNLEHFSLSARGFQEFIAHLENCEEAYRLEKVPDAGLIQVNIHDCDGNHIHVDFPISETTD